MTKQSLIDKVETMTLLNRTTKIGKALAKANQALSGRHATSMTVYLLTDGLPSDPKEFQTEAKSLRNYLLWKNLRNRLIMVAFGNSVHQKTFAEATRDSPWKTNDVFHATNLDSLYEIVPSLVDTRCKGKHFNCQILVTNHYPGQRLHSLYNLKVVYYHKQSTKLHNTPSVLVM